MRRGDSRGSIHRTSQARASSTRVSESTLCPLGQSKKAIGHESPIGPCVATHKVDNCQACCFRNEWRRHNSEMEPQGGRRISPFRVTKRSTKLRRLSKTTRLRVHVQTIGLNAETKKVSAPSRRGRMSLDIPFYRTSTVTASVLT